MHEITPTVSSPNAKELEKYEVIYWENHPVDYTLLALGPFFFFLHNSGWYWPEVLYFKKICILQLSMGEIKLHVQS